MTIGKETGKPRIGLVDNTSFTGLISDLEFYRAYRGDLNKV